MGGLLSDQFDLSVVLKIAAQGGAKTTEEVVKLQDAVDKLSRSGDLTEKQTAKLTSSLGKQTTAMNNADSAVKKGTESLNSQRYALYEVAAAYGAVSAGLVGLGASAIGAFAELESGFTKVERTSGLYGSSFAPLQEDLLSLGRAIPTVTEEIQDLAARGAQLGIATGDIEGFTEVLAKFIATSPEVDVNSVAEAFGRISNLTGTKDFEALASAVAQVGVNSAATDAQIIKTTQEIARATSSTTLAADEVIGLAAAFASLGVAPEAARGILNQFFAQLDKGAAGLNDSLAGAAQIIGTTEEAARSLYKTDTGAFFEQFITGLSGVEDITVALDGLGLQGQRLLPAFKALAEDTARNAAGQSVLANALRDSNQGFREKTELERQYAPIADDLNSKQIILANSVKELAFTLVSEFGPAIKLFVDGLTGAVQGLTDFIGTPLGSSVVKWVVVLGTLVAVYTTLRTAIALATAFQLAFSTAAGTGAARGLAGSLQGLITAYKGTATSATVAATGVTRLKSALLLLGKATIVGAAVQGVVFAISDIPGTAVNAGNALIWFSDAVIALASRISSFLGLVGALGTSSFRKLGNDLTKWGKQQQKASGETADLTGLLGGLNESLYDVADATGGAGSGLDDLGGSAANAAEEIRTVVDYANDLQEVFSRAFELEFGNLKAQDAVTKTFNELRNKAAEAEQKIKDIRTSIRGLMADIGILQSDIGTQEYFLSIALEYGDTKRAAEIQANLAKIQADLASKQNDLTKAQDELTKAQDSNSKTLVGNSDQAIANRETVIGLVESYQAQLVALAKSGASQEELRKKSEQLRQDFIRQATQLGFNREELRKYETSFVNLTAVINQVPRNVSTKMEITGLSAAEAALREFAAKSATIGAQAGGNFKNGFGGAANQVVPGPQIVTPPPTPWVSWEAMRKYFSENIFSKLATKSGQSAFSALVKSGYANGGYTGPGGKYEPAGIVHKGEYVIPKRDVNQSTGRPRADALGKLTRGSQASGGYANGGFVQSSGLGGVVSLDAQSIQQIARAMQTQVYIGDKIVGEAASKSYVADNRVGAN